MVQSYGLHTYHVRIQKVCQKVQIWLFFFFFFSFFFGGGGGGVDEGKEDLKNTTVSGQSLARQGNAI